MPFPTALVIFTAAAREQQLLQYLPAAGWVPESASTPARALELLRSGEYGAVFCDETLRGASSAGFLAWTRRLQPHARFFIFGAADDWRANAGKPDGFLSWPPILAEFPLAPGTMTLAPPQAEDGVPMSGSTSLISLPQLMEMIQVGQRSAVVRLNGGRGQVFLQRGVVLHASHHDQGRTRSGMPALAHLLTMEETDFAVEEFSKPSRATINLPVPGALAEAARQADEQRRDQELVAWLIKEQPRLQAIAVGDPLDSTPSDGHGDASALFSLAVSLLAGNRSVLGSLPRSVCTVGDKVSIAIHAFGRGRLVAVSVAGPAGAVLLRLLEKAVATLKE